MTTTNPRDINDTTAESASDGVYHVVCHDCTLEAVCDNDAPARQLVDGHSHHYGHDVECQRVTDPRGGQR